jgi:uncharacterized cupin superfamily protein
MVAPPKWSEPYQTPEFEEYTYIIRGKKQFIIEDETIILEAGQSIKMRKTRVCNTLTLLIKNVNTFNACLPSTLLRFIEE